MTMNKFLNDALKICSVVSNLLFRDFHFCLFCFMRLLKLCARVLHGIYRVNSLFWQSAP